MPFKVCAFNLAIGGSQRTCLFIVKDQLYKAGKNSAKRIVNPYTKRCASPFEIDGNDIAIAAPEFLLTDSDHDDNKQDEIKILTVQFFAF